ncbi:PLP-dependent transferase [Mesorhizobium sp.]|uniref:PLP-dependent transferase n=1 Tax=Mesorhizobium sp. TaxID=1871066 RepID=UPI00257B0DD5|nr:PLP-dependent transferase [Mesorhizobium sp.]
MLASTFQRLGIETRFVDPSDPERFREASDRRTRCWFGEALPNPKLSPFPIVEVGAIAQELGIPLIIDNTLTPLISRPLELGAHITVRSTSKYISGHGTTIGGITVDGGTFDWAAYSERFSLMSRPDISHGNILWLDAARNLPGPYGASPFLLKMRNTLMRDFGPCPSPFASFLCIQGLETLPLRMPRHCSNARQLAEFLMAHPGVLDVTYPTFGGIVERHRAEQNMGDHGGPMLVFEIAGGIEAGRRFIERLRLAYHVSNIGDARTLATHPASTTHASVPREARLAAGVCDGTIRISVGLVAILVFAGGLGAIALDILILKETVTTRKAFAMTMVFLGGYVVIAGDGLMTGSIIGVSLALIAGLGYASFIFAWKFFKLRSSLETFWWCLAYGLVMLAVPYAWSGAPIPSVNALPSLLSLGVIPSFFGFYCTILALQHIEAYKTQVIESSEPFFSALLAAALFGEWLTGPGMFAALAIIVGALITSMPERRAVSMQVRPIGEQD